MDPLEVELAAGEVKVRYRRFRVATPRREPLA
jgi:hypothetical protein